MSEFMKRAACHEAGHIIVAFKLGIRVESVRVANGLLLTDVWADYLDSTSRPKIDRYAFLAGGIAGEQFIFGDYDRIAMRDDQAKVTQRNGAAIETYIPEALAIVTANESCLGRIRQQLTINWIAARAEAQLCSDSDSYPILSRVELDDILRSC
jgi:hypothetical protein